jgi:hypothetical protein
LASVEAAANGKSACNSNLQLPRPGEVRIEILLCGTRQRFTSDGSTGSSQWVHEPKEISVLILDVIDLKFEQSK